MALVARLLLNCLRQKRNLLVWDDREVQTEMYGAALRYGGFPLINKLARCGGRSVKDAPRSALCLYTAEWQLDVILPTKTELCTDSVTLPLNRLIAIVYYRDCCDSKKPEQKETCVTSLQHVGHLLYICCLKECNISTGLCFYTLNPFLLDSKWGVRLLRLHWVTLFMHHLSCDVFFSTAVLETQCASKPMSYCLKGKYASQLLVNTKTAFED